jgi:histidinol-phosphatase (PHP family)
MLYDFQIPITFGSDAHYKNQVGTYLSQLEKEAKKIGYKNVAIFKNKKMELLKIV